MPRFSLDRCRGSVNSIGTGGREGRAAERALWQWVRTWRQVAPKAVNCLLRDWEALLAFYGVPDRDWQRVRTTNAIERVFREIRRGTRPMTCFTNVSCDRIVFPSRTQRRWEACPLWRDFTQNS